MYNTDFIIKNPKAFDTAMQKRRCQINSDQVLDLISQKKNKTTALQGLQSKKNKINSDFRNADLNEKERLINHSRALEEEIFKAKSDLDGVCVRLDDLLLQIPNIPDNSVPAGKNEKDNKEVLRFGSTRKFNFTPKSHDQLGVNLGILDFEKTAEICGSRFATLKGDLARLARCLIDFAIEHNNSFGYQELFMPCLVKEEAMYGAGQLPKFANESFKTQNNFRLIPTSEVTLSNFLSRQCFSAEELPLRMTAYSECFRQEAGSSGKDTKGIIRQHQFGKVELFCATEETSSDQELESMTAVVEGILQKLEIPYRKVLLCTGDMGFCAKKTYDIEVWIPSQNCYREISSCSNCGDFQSRRMLIKHFPAIHGNKKFAHTLNASCLPIGRTLVAIMENYQNSDGTIDVPEIISERLGKTKLSQFFM